MSRPSPPIVDSARFVRFGVLFYGAMALVAVLWRVGLYREPIWQAASGPAGVAWWTQAGLGVGVAAAAVLVSYGVSERTGWGRRLARAMAEPLRGLSVPDVLLLAAASGLAEEMFFRGALQPRVGLVVASALFGAVHFAPRRELLPWTGSAVVMGFVFGWLFDRTGSLLAPVIAHTLINAVNIPLLVRRYGDESARG